MKVDTDKDCSSLISDDEEEFDPESYYATDSREETPQEVKKFLESTLGDVSPGRGVRLLQRSTPNLT